MALLPSSKPVLELNVKSLLPTKALSKRGAHKGLGFKDPMTCAAVISLLLLLGISKQLLVYTLGTLTRLQGWSTGFRLPSSWQFCKNQKFSGSS
jgi:hypothetical protein